MNSKIAYICGSLGWGGLEMNQLRNAIWMKERGHSVIIYCPTIAPLYKSALQNGISVRTIAKHKNHFDLPNAWKLYRLLNRDQITHLIVRAPSDMSIAASVKAWMGKKLHLSYFMEMQLPSSKKQWYRTLRFHYFDLWSCPLPYLAEQVKNRTKFPSDRIAVIPSGIDLKYYSSQSDHAEAKRKIGVSEDKICFGLIGRFDSLKNQLLLLEAILKCKNQNFHVILMGESTKNENRDYEMKLYDFIHKNQLEKRVFIKPFQNSPTLFYQAIDWLVMSSRFETFGMVTLEAMASGKPTLGSRAGGTIELLEGETLGLLFESENIEDLASKIDSIIDCKIHIDPELLRKKAEQYDNQIVCRLVEEKLGLSPVIEKHF